MDPSSSNFTEEEKRKAWADYYEKLREWELQQQQQLLQYQQQQAAAAAAAAAASTWTAKPSYVVSPQQQQYHHQQLQQQQQPLQYAPPFNQQFAYPVMAAPAAQQYHRSPPAPNYFTTNVPPPATHPASHAPLNHTATHHNNAISSSSPSSLSQPYAHQSPQPVTTANQWPTTIRPWIERSLATAEGEENKKALQTAVTEYIRSRVNKVWTIDWEREPLLTLSDVRRPANEIPDALKTWLERCLASGDEGGELKAELTRIVQEAHASGSTWAIDWESKPLVTLKDLKKANRQKAKKMKREDEVAFAGAEQQSTSGFIPLSGVAKKRSDDRSNGPTGGNNNNNNNKKLKRLIAGTSSNEKNEVKALKKPSSLSPTPTNTYAEDEEEMKRRATRAERFTSSLPGVATNEDNLSSGERTRLEAKRIAEAMKLADMRGEELDLSRFTIKGTCQELEKPFLRLTSVPDPATVRPESVLVRALESVESKLWPPSAAPPVPYKWANEQFKSIRQDLSIQHIKNDFTVRAYELHAKAAAENGDLQEFNQCATQLRELYESGLGTRPNRILFRCLALAYHVLARSLYGASSSSAVLNIETWSVREWGGEKEEDDGGGPSMDDEARRVRELWLASASLDVPRLHRALESTHPLTRTLCRPLLDHARRCFFENVCEASKVVPLPIALARGVLCFGEAETENFHAFLAEFGAKLITAVSSGEGEAPAPPYTHIDAKSTLESRRG